MAAFSIPTNFLVALYLGMPTYTSKINTHGTCKRHTWGSYTSQLMFFLTFYYVFPENEGVFPDYLSEIHNIFPDQAIFQMM